MKKIMLCLMFVGSLGFAQSPVRHINRHYIIVSDMSDSETGQIAETLEAFYEVFNRLFRFDAAGSPVMNVRIITDTDEYNNYVNLRTDSLYEGAIYIHYNRAERCELVINGKAPPKAIARQALVQYFRSFIPRPPAWMLEGFAIYFESLTYENGVLSFRENLSRLPLARSASLPLQDILLEGGNGAEFQAVAWSVVLFLMNGKEDYRRSLTESFVVLLMTSDARAVCSRILLGTDIETFTNDYRQYINERKTFAELVYEGQRAYSEGDAVISAVSFLEAIELQDNFLSYYYLGLISYDREEYSKAEQYFLGCIERGGDLGACLYALGVNAAAAGNNQAAIDYLNRASQESAQHKEKSENLIQLLRLFN